MSSDFSKGTTVTTALNIQIPYSVGLKGFGHMKSLLNHLVASPTYNGRRTGTPTKTFDTGNANCETRQRGIAQR